MVDAVYTRVLLAVVAALTAALLLSSPAHAQDMSAQLEQFNAECFDSAGEFLGTDGCFEWAEEHIEIDNLLDSTSKGCVLSNMFEDYSCKGPEYKGYEYIGDEGATGPTTSTSSSVSEQDISVPQQLGFVGDPTDSLANPVCKFL